MSLRWSVASANAYHRAALQADAAQEDARTGADSAESSSPAETVVWWRPKKINWTTNMIIKNNLSQI